MKALELKESIEDLLAEYANGRFTVVSPRRKSDAASIFVMPQVTIYYSEGSFDKSKSSVNSPYHHDVTFRIYATVAAKATVNLAVLQNPAASSKEYSEALADAGNASVLVDEKTDELLSLLYDIIMRPEHRSLGADYIPSRWVSQIKKFNPEPMGAIVTETATVTLIAQCEEDVTSVIGKPGECIETIINPEDESKQGVRVNVEINP